MRNRGDHSSSSDSTLVRVAEYDVASTRHVGGKKIVYIRHIEELGLQSFEEVDRFRGEVDGSDIIHVVILGPHEFASRTKLEKPIAGKEDADLVSVIFAGTDHVARREQETMVEHTEEKAGAVDLAAFVAVDYDGTVAFQSFGLRPSFTVRRKSLTRWPRGMVFSNRLHGLRRWT